MYIKEEIKVIRGFKDEYAFLSNYEPCTVIDGYGRAFKNAEAMYQSYKFIDRDIIEEFTKLTADEAKQLAKKYANKVKSNWDDVKDEAMKKTVTAKFLQNDDLGKKLLATGNAYLMEANDWWDNYWGVYPSTGEVGKDGLNRLGEIIMDVRSKLQYIMATYKKERSIR